MLMPRVKLEINDIKEQRYITLVKIVKKNNLFDV